jgi:ABC-type glycerol-3-phosphate transport system substrate-binding protein
MLRKAGIVAVSAALGLAAAIGVAACGEDREGEVRIEGGTTGTSTSGTTGGTTGTTPTETTPGRTERTETSP